MQSHATSRHKDVTWRGVVGKGVGGGDFVGTEKVREWGEMGRSRNEKEGKGRLPREWRGREKGGERRRRSKKGGWTGGGGTGQGENGRRRRRVRIWGRA